jgi:two-component system, OmpR family, phosphate regulon sensor histidine kinase PhoR
MSRRMLVTLIVLMALVLSGLILVQTNLIKTASDIREEQFDQIVTVGLRRIVDLLELNEQKLARNYAQLGNMPGNNPAMDIFPRQSTGQISGGFQFSQFSFSDGSIFGSFEEHYQVIITDPDSVQPGQDLTFPDHPSKSTFFDQLNEFNFDQERRREKWLEDMAWRNYEILLEGRPLRERIDSTFLENWMSEIFNGLGIDLEYKYAVKSTNQGQDKFILGSPDYDPSGKKEYYSLLFPFDFHGQQPNYLYVYFPKRSGYLLRATGFTIIPTIILTRIADCNFCLCHHDNSPAEKAFND